MGRFLQKVLKFLTKFRFFRFESRKFLDFLLSIWDGKKGDMIQNVQNVANNITDTLEEFEDIAKEKANLSSEEILKEIEIMNPDLVVSEKNKSNFEELLTEIRNVEQLKILQLSQGNVIGDIVDYAKDLVKESSKKMETKFKIAKEMIVEDLEKNGVEYTIQVVRYCIESAVISKYGKDK